MPSLFSSSVHTRSRSFADTTPTTTAIAGPYGRRGSAAIEALTRGLKKKSEMEVVLEGKDEFIRTFSTFDQIKGHVLLKFEKDTLIGDLHIVFEGQSQTFVEKVAYSSPTTGRTTGKHIFLRVQQPISPDSLPEHNLAKAGVTYTIPFAFVVPDRVLPYTCSHKTAHNEVRRIHLRLPPSFGDSMLTGEGNILMDDLAPEMSRISYAVRARLGKGSPTTGRLLDIEEKVTRVRIAPSRQEEPPLALDGENSSYIIRSEKNVRRGVFKIGKKLGRLTAEVGQPKSLKLPAPASTAKAPVTTMAAVTIRFDPASDQESPPQLGNLAVKLRAYTFFGAAAFKDIPQAKNLDTWSAVHGVYHETIPLSCRNIGSVSWTKHGSSVRKKSLASICSDDDEMTRRESTLSTESSASLGSTASIPNASCAYNSSLPFYTAKVLVPVSIPHRSDHNAEAPSTSAKSVLSRNSKKIIFVPTFHTCVISRTYALELDLSFHPVNGSGAASSALSTSSVTLRTPVQISQEGTHSPPEDESLAPYDIELTEGTDDYDEAVARQLDHELNFSNPFAPHAIGPDHVPEYQETVQTGYSNGDRVNPLRSHSIAFPPSHNSSSAVGEQPPEYYSPFRTPGASSPHIGARRVSIRIRP